jgi:hypothetical protein
MVKYGGCCNALTLDRIWTLNALDAGAAYVRWLAIDFKKAFDTVSHKKILLTLSTHFLVPTNLIAWLFDYFTDRLQRVIVNASSYSPFLQCSSGVPQGSILGPFLFAALLDPCLLDYNNCKLICYADDVTILHKVMPSQPDMMQNIADSFILTANDQGLEINPDKCQTITFCSRRSSSLVPPVISLGSKLLSPVESMKILGVHFTADLKWSLHLDFVYKKCARASYLIKLLHQRGLSGRFLHSICNSLVFSHLTYCWPVLCDCSNLLLKRFVALDNRLQKLHLVPADDANLRSSLDRQCFRLARKISQLEGHPLTECFERSHSISGMSLRSKKKFMPLRAKSEKLRNSFTRFAC